MARLSIYVPDDRMPEIEKWRETMSFSQIFLEAFERAAATLNKTKIRKTDMKTLVERLKKHSGEWFETGRIYGVSQGIHWAKKEANLSHLRAIGEGRMSFESRSVTDFLEGNYRLDYQPGWDQEMFAECHGLDGDADSMLEGFNNGFVDGAKGVWEQVKSAF